MNMQLEKKRILVVDDQASDTQLLKSYLERSDEYLVREENDAQAALSTAEEFQPDLILLDVLMPGWMAPSWPLVLRRVPN